MTAFSGGAMKARPARRAAAAACGLLLILGLGFEPAAAAQRQCVWTGVEKVVAVGDLHGDFENFCLILRGAGVTDDSLRWKAGGTHLVQLGDIMDRGPGARAIFDLLMRLEKEAQAAGGMVHVLLGNHEEMNITGIAFDYPGYVTVEQFVSFLPDEYRREREGRFLAGVTPAEREYALSAGPDIANNDILRGFWGGVLRNEPDARKVYLNEFNRTYGRWLLEKNAVIKINDVVFVHGGISESLATRPLEEINDLIRQELKEYQGRQAYPGRYSAAFRPKMLYNPESPLWFRGLATGNGSGVERELDRVLAGLKARAIVMGHSFMSNQGSSPVISLEAVSRFNSKVFVMDTGINRFYHGFLSALIMEGGRFTLWTPVEEITAPESEVRPEGAIQQEGSEDERFLRESTVVRVDRAGPAGRTSPWRVALAAGGVVREAVFKYVDRHRPGLLADSYQYELAAYALSRRLGLEFIPAVVERKVEGVPGALQILVGNAVSLEKLEGGEHAQPPDRAALENALADITVFCLLVADECRNPRDTLVVPELRRVYRVDFSQAFAPDTKLEKGCEIKKCSRPLYENLKKWDSSEIRSLLGTFLNDEELRALDRRRRLVLKSIESRIKAAGEAAVIFD
jgi:hypothetical protein